MARRTHAALCAPLGRTVRMHGVRSHRRRSMFRQHARRQGGSMSNGTIKEHGRVARLSSMTEQHD
eukprot:1897766-Pleurochrysis_carterae.AAC.1